MYDGFIEGFNALPLTTTASPLISLATGTFQVVSHVRSSGAGYSLPLAFSQRSMLALSH